MRTVPVPPLPRLILLAAMALLPGPRATSVAAEGRDGYRVLPPGVLTTIAADDSTEALTGRVDVPTLLQRGDVRDWKPEAGPADRTLRGQFGGPGGDLPPGKEVQREAWCLEFSFKPPRLIDVDVPAAGLKMERRRVWYLVYRVKNVGGWRLEIDEGDGSKREPKRVEMPVRFLPLFVLESRQAINESEGLAAYRGYADRAMPTAVAAIERRERTGQTLLDSAAMSATAIEPGEERWGVAVWENVHPDIGFFSIVVTGLSNRFLYRPPEAGADDGSVTLESLRLDFWKRGEASDPAAAEIAIGHAGLFERSTLGTSLLETVGRTSVSKAKPTQGLEAIGLAWDGILEPPLSPADAFDRRVPTSLQPLATVIERIAKAESPADRGRAIRDIFGDAGIETIEAVARSVMAPAPPDRAEARTRALAAIGVGADAFDGDTLAGLAKVIRGLDRVRPTADRDAAEAAVFGEDAGRFRLLLRWLSAARAAAVLESLGVDRAVLSTLGPRPAFEKVWKEIESLRDADGGGIDADGRSRLAAGLFGAEGPWLMAQAVAQHPGIEHEWFFRYEFQE